ncbi:threonine-phosphate decarboxylase [Geobacter sp. OR-1]|uniref:threonine-phosphate decarboxylase CobD n=1 Tax=Geobacter sp. OR-1 TaxID=1266765 RepID=UPI000541FD1C|nr:threonine-phosphate decarboxylase CobD [Geobacter sp. OR-1]GAM09619.1 threonine-phosphate decarboxylase [Geobacter sp. OR-1]
MSSYDHGGDIFGAARRSGVDPAQLLDFSASINPMGLSDPVRKAIIAGIDRIVHYPEPFAEPLRNILASAHSVAPEEILPANGSTELIYLLPRLVQGHRALIVAPAFSEYAKALTAAEWEVDYHILAPDNGFALECGPLEAVLAKGYDLLFLCNPGNPTGRLYSRGEALELVRICRKVGVFIVLDEAFMDFCGEEFSLLPELVASGKGVVLRSLTKFYALPGLRLGYAAAAADICRRLGELRGPWSVNALAQAAGVAAVNDAAYRRATGEFVAAERDLLSRRLAEIPGLTPFTPAANFLLVRITADLPAARLCRRLFERYGILIRDCSNFVGLGDRFFRVAVRTGKENDRLVSALQELLSELHR